MTDRNTFWSSKCAIITGASSGIGRALAGLLARRGANVGLVARREELLRELVQSKKFAAIGEAVTGIHHAIKNMLNTLKGGAYLVRIGMDKNRRQQIAEGRAMIEEGIGRITDLSDRLLHYAREWKPELQRVDLGALVTKVGESNRQAAAQQGQSPCVALAAEKETADDGQGNGWQCRHVKDKAVLQVYDKEQDKDRRVECFKQEAGRGAIAMPKESEQQGCGEFYDWVTGWNPRAAVNAAPLCQEVAGESQPAMAGAWSLASRADRQTQRLPPRQTVGQNVEQATDQQTE